MIPDQRSRHLYLHVPFCARKCDYCAFYSEPALHLADRYVAALNREIERVAPQASPATLFFGGGTPTLLTESQWTRILETLRRCFPSPAEEWSVECNPATLSLSKARLLREAGVNRISMGVQSLDETLLERLGRIHSRKAVFQSFDLLRKAGFDNINLDLMFAIPGQSMTTWRATLAEALQLGSEHLSCYEVIYEEDTPLFRRLAAGQIAVDEDLACAMYEELREAAAEHGLDQYEVANFARSQPGDPPGLPRRACQHNIAYWRARPFHGLGPSASSYLHQIRLRNLADTRLYCEALEQDRSPVADRDVLSPLARAGEIAAFGLRMVIGWSFAEFRAVTGFELTEHWNDPLNTLVERGWGERRPESFRLTREGLRFADAAAEMFLL